MKEYVGLIFNIILFYTTMSKGKPKMQLGYV